MAQIQLYATGTPLTTDKVPYIDAGGALKLSTVANLAANPITLTLAATTTAAVSLKVTGDSQQRHIVLADGKHQWGDGASAVDTDLFRSAAARLRTTADFQARRLGVGTTPQDAFLAYFGGTHPSTAASVYGFISQFTGPSTATGAIVGAYAQARTAAAAFTVGDLVGMQVDSPSIGAGSAATRVYGLQVLAQTGGTSSYGIAVNAATNQTLWVSADANNTTAAAGVAFGSSRDTTLYRSAASTLATDGTLIVATNLTLSGTAISGAGSSLSVNATAGVLNLGAAAANPQIFFNGGGVEYARWNASGHLQMAEGHHIQLGTTTGTKLGTATSQKLALWNTTPDVQPTTAITASTFVANTSGTLNDSATWGGYTVGQVVAALKRLGALA